MKDLFEKMIKFYIVGAAGTIVNLGMTYLLTHYFSIWYLMSNIIGIFLATTMNFFINRSWTFRSIKKHRKMMTQYFYYWGSNLVAISVQLCLGYFLTEYAHIWYIASILIAIIMGSIANFLINKSWTFKDLHKRRI